MSTSKLLEWTSNIAVILSAVVLICSVLLQHGKQVTSAYHPDVRQLEKDLLGAPFPKKDLMPEGGALTCVLVLSTECPFCEKNSAFYRKLSMRSTLDHFRLIGVFPQSQSEAEAYLRTKEIGANQVISAPLRELGVKATPTIFLVGAEGRTLAAWVGALDQARQNEVFAKLSEFSERLPKEKKQ